MPSTKPNRRARTLAGLFRLAGLTLAACAAPSPAPYSAGAGPFPPPGGAAGGGLDPSWMVCQGGNPRADYNCTLN